MSKNRPLHFEIFLIALATILLEVSYTRVISFKLVYYFTYLVIGFALLGLGAGGVLVAMLPRLRESATERALPALCLAGALGVLLSYAVTVFLPVNALELARALPKGSYDVFAAEGLKLGVLCLSIVLPFLASGLAITRILATNPNGINRLYFFDLLGAGAGCVLAVPLLYTLSPPGGVLLAAACFALAGVPLARAVRSGVGTVLGGVFLASVVLVALATRLPDPQVDSSKTMNREKLAPVGTVLYSEWSPVFRVDVVDANLPDAHVIIHDGIWGSVLPRFDGDLDGVGARYEKDMRSYPFRLLGEGPNVLIIGAAGGNEVLASLYFGAEHVTGVELNPVTHSLLTERFVDFSSGFALDERVSYVNAEGRSFLESTDEIFDVVWFVTPDSYAAMNASSSGAYVLSEAYLYTVEMIDEALDHLSPEGIIVAHFGEIAFDGSPTRTPRFLATARRAFEKLGVEDFDQHVMVATQPTFPFQVSTIILKKTPLTETDLQNFADATANIEKGRVRFTSSSPRSEHPVDRVVRLPQAELDAWYPTYRFDVTPTTDDAPFFWHFARFGNALAETFAPVRLGQESGNGERLLVLLLFISVTMAALFLLAPLLLQRRVWSAIPHKLPAAIYFASIGLGFMLLEISLIQRFTLFLGYPTYSLTVTLFSLLVSTAVGSLATERLRPSSRTFGGMAGAMIALVAFYAWLLPSVLGAFLGEALLLRAAIAFVSLAPLGLCLGVFMPLGLRIVASISEHGEEYVAWAWAINGFTSVVGSLLATFLSMFFGFTAVLFLSLGIYLVAILAMSRVPAARPA